MRADNPIPPKSIFPLPPLVLESMDSMIRTIIESTPNAVESMPFLEWFRFENIKFDFFNLNITFSFPDFIVNTPCNDK